MNFLILHLPMEIGKQADDHQSRHQDAEKVDRYASVDDPANGESLRLPRAGVVHPAIASSGIILLSKERHLDSCWEGRFNMYVC